MSDRNIALENLRLSRITFEATMMNLGVNTAILELNFQLLQLHSKTHGILEEILKIIKTTQEET